MTEEYVRKTIKLNKQLWDKFQQKIEEEYGTTYKHTSEEMEKAIENYIEEDIADLEKTKTKINNLNDENKLLKEKVLTLEKNNEKLNDELLNEKTRTKKTETTNQQLKDSLNKISIDKNNLENSIKNLDNENRSLKNENKILTDINKNLESENKNLEEKYMIQVEETNKQVQENTKIKNKREHAQERLNKTQDELNDTLKRLEKYSFAIGQVQNMSFLDRLFNRLPEQVKELQPGKDEEE